MSRKRSRTQASGGCRKRARVSKASHPPEQCLPHEVLRTIASFSLATVDRCRPEVTTVLHEVFSNPLLKVGRAWRAAALDAIAQGFLWIEVRAQSVKYLPLLRYLGRYCPLMTDSLEHMVPSRKPTLTFEIGEETDASSRTRQFAKSEHRVIFPFNYQSLMYLMVELRRRTTARCIDFLSVTCSPIPSCLKRCMQDQVLSMVKFALRIHWRIECSGLDDIDTEHIVAISWSKDILSTWENVKFAIREINRLRDFKLVEQAALFSLHSGSVLKSQANFVLCHPKTWAPREMSREDREEDSKLKLRFATIRMLHSIEQYAYSAYKLLSKDNGAWEKINGFKVTERYMRWNSEPLCTWFGLGPMRLAEYHFTASNWHADRARLNGRSPESAEKLKLMTNNMMSMLKHRRHAASLWPSKYGSKWAQVARACQSLNWTETSMFGPDRISFEDIDGNDVECVGDPDMVTHWVYGWTMEALPYLPRAKKYMLYAMGCRAYQPLRYREA